jgi:hypothetical protein
MVGTQGSVQLVTILYGVEGIMCICVSGISK